MAYKIIDHKYDVVVVGAGGAGLRATFGMAEKNLKNWLYTIAINTARDHHRKKKRRAETSDENELQFVDKNNLELNIDNKLVLEKLMGLLPLDLKEVVTLYYFEEKSVKEISEVLEIKESLVKVRLFRARQNMLDEFKRLSDEL